MKAVSYTHLDVYKRQTGSGVIIFVWTIILGVHLLLFFLSTGVLGKEYENVPVKVIAQDLLNMVKDRNSSFKKSITRKEPNKPNP